VFICEESEKHNQRKYRIFHFQNRDNTYNLQIKIFEDLGVSEVEVQIVTTVFDMCS